MSLPPRLWPKISWPNCGAEELSPIFVAPGDATSTPPAGSCAGEAREFTPLSSHAEARNTRRNEPLEPSEFGAERLTGEHPRQPTWAEVRPTIRSLRLIKKHG